MTTESEMDEFKQAAVVVSLAIDLARLERAPRDGNVGDVSGYIPVAVKLIHAARKQLSDETL